MIQLNNVSSASSSTAATSLASSLDPSSLESFESALSDAVTQTLQQFGINPNSVNISIAPASATSTSAAAATSTPATVSNSTSPAPVAPDLAGLIPFLGTSSGSAAAPNPTAASSSASTASQPAATQSAATQSAENPSAENPQQSFDEAYWAQQPAAVQALQSIDDPGQRTEMAQQLATQGYTIDVPIMAWGWDPSAVTSLRQSYGYTWVPSGFQNPIQSAPGINDPGITPYDPNNPPAGSIAV